MQKRIQKETLTKSKGFLTITVKPNLAAFRQNFETLPTKSKTSLQS